jgi:hypothetical protein
LQGAAMPVYVRHTNEELAKLIEEMGEWNAYQISKTLNRDRSSVAYRLRSFRRQLLENRPAVEKYQYLLQYPSKSAGTKESVFLLKPEHQASETSLQSTTTLYDADGSPKLQWVKQDHRQRLLKEQIEESFRETLSEIPKIPKIVSPKKSNTDLLTVIPIGDQHVGMYSWYEETGEDFDLDIVKDLLYNAVKRIIDSTPKTDQLVIINVGDFFHTDTPANVTTRSNHALDVDTRYQKMIRVGIDLMRSCIELGLSKHRKVHVINEIGNHDDITSQFLTIALSMYYEKNSRVTFDKAPTAFHYYEFGKVLLGATHGDKIKPDKLPGIMATDKPEEWGAAKFRYWWVGHFHHRVVHELPGCVVEIVRTLAAKDAWHSSMGYRAGRDIQAVIYHKEYGEVERHTIGIEQL